MKVIRLSGSSMSSFLFLKRLSSAMSFILTVSKSWTGILCTLSWKNPKVISLVSLSPLVILGLFIRNDSFKLPSIELYSCKKSEKLCDIPFKIGFLFSGINSGLERRQFPCVSILTHYSRRVK